MYFYIFTLDCMYMHRRYIIIIIQMCIKSNLQTNRDVIHYFTTLLGRWSLFFFCGSLLNITLFTPFYEDIATELFRHLQRNPGALRWVSNSAAESRLMSGPGDLTTGRNGGDVAATWIVEPSSDTSRTIFWKKKSMCVYIYIYVYYYYIIIYLYRACQWLCTSPVEQWTSRVGPLWVLKWRFPKIGVLGGSSHLVNGE